MYKLSFDFPYGVTYLKSLYLDDRISCTIEIPEFTSDMKSITLLKQRTFQRGK